MFMVVCLVSYTAWSTNCVVMHGDGARIICEL